MLDLKEKVPSLVAGELDRGFSEVLEGLTFRCSVSRLEPWWHVLCLQEWEALHYYYSAFVVVFWYEMLASGCILISCRLEVLVAEPVCTVRTGWTFRL